MITTEEQITIAAYNDPKTYAIVNKGTNEVVKFRNKKQYFRTKLQADKGLYEIIKATLSDDYDLIQLRPNRTGETVLQASKLANKPNSPIIRSKKINLKKTKREDNKK